ncbi:tyrosine--tRNA ligase [Streptomyces agglomeratus]|uniref:Tyrosine--tRNA ligase n=2 Tax=Streptomyces agglomeratus TaxID=285458 RepID=A0A1E5NYP8_9ACTN|nr:tyrosine--tRNA ligase [Streptomyces agglomeratus]OEJ22852.1 tyrosine--tRNA ligase [Streptomyces agglomeratus]OEJ36419.1 tyrosine--tRNA ligase [Streptomyces agglomeratus]OEJ56561.1 tyrosine--tRNA ligase [Streptomyces agglomeratus]
MEDGFLEVPPGSLAEKLKNKEHLRVKFGVDPTAAAVTWGWSVPLRRLRRFQELGHTAVLIIGDYTAQVGDPSGKSQTRRRLDGSEVERYIEACTAALLEILSPERLEVRRNSEWLGRMGMQETLELASQVTVAQLLERDDFRKRHTAHEPISMIEFMYPLLQGYDSVAVEADVELGGTDQQFNFMLARTLQQRAGQAPQACLCAPLLVGTDGKKKMSQSYGNFIGVAETPEEIFGKAMSIPDEAMEQYVRLALDLPGADKENMLQNNGGVALKRALAKSMAAMFHGADAAERAEEAFNQRHVRREAPTDMPEGTTTEQYLPKILLELSWASSLSDARRAIEGRGVRLDGEVVEDAHHNVSAGTYTMQLGRRRFYRLTVM